MSAPSDLRLITRLRAAGFCVATVESCTGGQLAQRLTAEAGASRVYWGGWVTYDNSAKQSQVGVPAPLIELRGAVSAEVAVAMAVGGLAEMDRAIDEASTVGTAPHRVCLATTGVAGPDGGTDAKPVGLCYVGIAATGMPAVAIEVRLPPGGDRAANQAAFVDAALGAIERLLAAVEAKLSATT